MANGLVITVQRASGYIAGWFNTIEEAEGFARECTERIPNDPARVVVQPSLSAWVAANRPAWAAA